MCVCACVYGGAWEVTTRLEPARLPARHVDRLGLLRHTDVHRINHPLCSTRQTAMKHPGAANGSSAPVGDCGTTGEQQLAAAAAAAAVGGSSGGSGGGGSSGGGPDDVRSPTAYFNAGGTAAIVGQQQRFEGRPPADRCSSRHALESTQPRSRQRACSQRLRPSRANGGLPML